MTIIHYIAMIILIAKELYSDKITFVVKFGFSNESIHRGL